MHETHWNKKACKWVHWEKKPRDLKQAVNQNKYVTVFYCKRSKLIK